MDGGVAYIGNPCTNYTRNRGGGFLKLIHRKEISLSAEGASQQMKVLRDYLVGKAKWKWEELEF